MDVGGNLAGSLITGKTTNADLLADGNSRLAHQVGDGLALVVHELLRQQRIHIGGVLLGDVLGHIVGEVQEVVSLGHEVGLAVDLNDHTHGCVLVGVLSYNALGRNTAGLLGGLAQTLLTQPFNSLVHIAVACDKRLLAIHHASAGALAQFLYHSRGNSCHRDSLL